MMLPGRATLRVCSRGVVGVKRAVGLDVSTELCVEPLSRSRFRFCGSDCQCREDMSGEGGTTFMSIFYGLLRPIIFHNIVSRVLGIVIFRATACGQRLDTFKRGR